MDFALIDAQRALPDTARRFAREHLMSPADGFGKLMQAFDLERVGDDIMALA